MPRIELSGDRSGGWRPGDFLRGLPAFGDRTIDGSVESGVDQLGRAVPLPAQDYLGKIIDSDGLVLLCLHKWGSHEHPSLMSPDHGAPGNGLLLFFRVNDFELAFKRARSLFTRLEEEAHVN